MPDVPEIVLRMVHEFDDVFWECSGTSVLTQKEVFDALNTVYEDYFGHKRYSSFDSYRKVRNRRIREQCPRDSGSGVD